MKENRSRFFVNGKLVSWSQRHCKLCGKFISKTQRIYCLSCRLLMDWAHNIIYHREAYYHKGKYHYKKR